MTFTEDQMADVVIAQAETLLGEPLRLLDRKRWIGRYELDLVFEDRHGGKLIVELQRGTLDRYHLYKVLDYYDEYKSRHRQNFVEVMVVANLISPERKERLSKRSINYKEIPDSIIEHYLAMMHSTPALTKGDTITSDLRTKGRAIIENGPDFLRHQVQQFLEDDEGTTLTLFGTFAISRLHEPWVMPLTIMQHFVPALKQSKDSVSRFAAYSDMKLAVGQLYSSILIDEKGGIAPSHFEEAVQRCASELRPFLEIAFGLPNPRKFLTTREQLIEEFVKQIEIDPNLLLRLCHSYRTFWIDFPLILEDAEAQLFLEYLGVSLASIIHGVTIKLFQGKRLPIGIDKRSQFITRTVPATNIALHTRSYTSLLFSASRRRPYIGYGTRMNILATISMELFQALKMP